MICLGIKMAMKEIKQSNQKGFKGIIKILRNYVLLSSIYFLVSTWIFLYSDWTDRTFFVVRNFLFLCFVLVTAYSLLREMFKVYQKAATLEVAFANQTTSEADIYKTYEFLDAFHHLMIKLIDQENVTEEEIIILLFELIMKKVTDADCGSVYKLSPSHVTFIAAKGYDINLLNELPFNPKEFKLQIYNVTRDQSLEKSIEKQLKGSAYDHYAQHAPRIAESIHLGVLSTKGHHWGVSIDMSVQKQNKDHTTFTEGVIRELKELQTLISSFFRLQQLNVSKTHLQKEIVRVFVLALENHDEYTKGHSDQVATLALEIGQKMGLSPKDINDLMWASIVHDIGKLAIPSQILNKPGKLTDKEYDTIKDHVVIGANYLKESPELEDISDLILHHHERFDGKGYPYGIMGEDIPLLSRIITLADAWDAMVSERPYKVARTKEEALEEIQKEAGKQFCPEVVKVFIDLLDCL